MSREETNEGRRSSCYEVLGVAPGAPEREVKAAYRDLAKVWHPDRFTHDPRLQQKAQEKLKEINEAYRQLTTGAPPPRRARAASDAHTTAQHAAHDASETRRGAPRPRVRFDWRWLVPALAFCATFAFVTPRLLSTSRPAAGDDAAASSQQPPEARPSSGARASEARDEDGAAAEQNNSRARKASDGAAGESATGRAESAAAVGGGESAAGVGATSAGAVAARQPLPTVSVTVDPTTNQIARAGCPQKLRVTFPAGEEPRAHCEAAHARAEPAADEEKARNKSRLKAFAGRVASPSKWLGGDGPSDAPAKKPDAPQQQSPERD